MGLLKGLSDNKIGGPAENSSNMDQLAMPITNTYVNISSGPSRDDFAQKKEYLLGSPEGYLNIVCIILVHLVAGLARECGNDLIPSELYDLPTLLITLRGRVRVVDDA